MSIKRSALHVGKVLPPPYAGIEAHIEQLLPALQDDVDCTLLVSEVGFKRRTGAPRPYPVIAARTVARAASTPFNPGMPLLMRKWAHAHPQGLVHLHMPNPMGDLSTRFLPRHTPLVVTWHSDIVRQRLLLKAYWPMLRALLDRADRVIAFTPKHVESSTQVTQVPPEKLRIVPIGIDPAPLALTAEVAHEMALLRSQLGHGPIVFTLGRHVYYKGYSYLVEATKGLPRDAKVVLAGTGPLTAALKQQAHELGVADRVVFLGTVSEARKVALMRLCDVFCLPSIEPSEAFGVATAEAMLCEKPAVVCELGNGVNYLSRPGVTGLTVPPRDSRALAAALCELLRDDAVRRRLGQQAAAWVRSEFSMEAMCRGTVRAYDEALGRPPVHSKVDLPHELVARS
jgi:glycosyltransferase involved in cell wall biosynthesis